jgi:hypothetical protein
MPPLVEDTLDIVKNPFRNPEGVKRELATTISLQYKLVD